MPDEEVLARMRQDWDERARDNAYHYIASDREEWDERAFYESGRESVETMLTDDAERAFRGRDPRLLRVLEIGCGAGRMTRALADVAGEIHAVDVSAEMVGRAKAAVEGWPNAFVYLTDGCGLGCVPIDNFDLAFSFIVFQHIPSREVIESYFREVAAKLNVGGVFKLQTQGSPTALLGKQDTWEGCYVPPATWLGWSRQYGYRLFDFAGAGTQYLWLWWERVGAGAGGELSEVELRFLEAGEGASADALYSLVDEIRVVCEEREVLRRERDAAVVGLERTQEALAKIHASAAYRLAKRLGLAGR